MTTELNQKKKKKRSPVLLTTILLLFLLIVILVTLAFFTSFDEVTNRFQGGKIDIILTEPSWKPEKALSIVPDATLAKDPYITNNEDIPAYVFLKVTVPAVKYNYDNDNDTNSKGTKVPAPTDYVPLYKFYKLVDNNNPHTPNNLSDDTPTWNSSLNTAQEVYSDWRFIDTNDNPDPDNPKPKLINADTPSSAVFEYVYVYKENETVIKELAPHTTTVKPLFDGIHLLNIRNDDKFPSGTRNYSIKVQAYGIQTKYLSNNGVDINVNDPIQIWNKINS